MLYIHKNTTQTISGKANFREKVDVYFCWKH